MKFRRKEKMKELSLYADQFEGRMSGYDRSKLKLDLNSPSAISGSKRSLLSHVSNTSTPGLLGSPDLKMLKLGSPELERIIIQNHGLITTPTPTEGSDTCSTDEQEQFARGFVEALQRLHEKEVPSSEAVELSNDRKLKLRNSTANSNSGSATRAYQSNQYLLSEKQARDSFVLKGEDTKPPISSVATTASKTFGQTSRSHSHHDVNERTTQGHLISRPNTLHFTRGSSSNSTTISFPPGYTTSPNYEANCHLTVAPVASDSTAQHDTFTTPVAKKFNMVCSTIVSGSSSLSQNDAQALSVPTTTANLLDPTRMSVDDGAQIVPSSTPPVPIDLDMQEAIKHERKKLRNRLAAQRCRKRKIEREEVLKIKVRELKAKNSDLTSTASELRLQVCELKQKLMNHVNQGCQIFVPQSSLD